MSDSPTYPQRFDDPAERAGRRCSRRAFLAGVGQKAIYIAPVVLSLFARTALASGGTPSCKPVGDACLSNGSCCTSRCGPADTCCLPNWESCDGTDSDCCSGDCRFGWCWP